MQVDKLFPLNSPDKRKRNKFIILTHISNMSLRLDPMIPEYKGFVPYYVADKHRRYYAVRNQKNRVPFHYLINKINGDWERMVMSPLTAKSEMLAAAVSSGYIDSFYADAIVIAIQDDYSIRTPDTRAYEVIGSDIVAPLLDELKLGKFNDCVLWLDEIFNFEKYNKDMEQDPLGNKYPYEVRPMRYYNDVFFRIEMRRF